MEQVAAIRISVGGVLVVLVVSSAALFWRDTPTSSPPGAFRGGESDNARDLSEHQRRVVDSAQQRTVQCVDRLIQKNADTVNDIIARADQTAKNIEAIADQLHGPSNEADPRIQELLDNLDQASAEAKNLITTATRELQQSRDELCEQSAIARVGVTHDVNVGDGWRAQPITGP